MVNTSTMVNGDVVVRDDKGTLLGVICRYSQQPTRYKVVGEDLYAGSEAELVKRLSERARKRKGI